MNIQRKPTREVKIGNIRVGGTNPIAVQSMTATRTEQVTETSRQVQALYEAGADVVRVAMDSRKEIDALRRIRSTTEANLCVDLQENYSLAVEVAPHVDKIRYNPGHLYHHEPTRPWRDKVRQLVEVATTHECAMRVGVNCGSVDPAIKERFTNPLDALVASALEHAEFLDSIGFTRYCVSLKDSDPDKVVTANRRFAEQRPDIPLHLGVTEAGLPPDGIIKTRVALEQLIGRGIGDTVRVSLTLPNSRKHEEIEVARQILADISEGRVRTVVPLNPHQLNIISCPSCSRVENERFVELAQDVKELTHYAKDHALTIAVMGCRVNGPGETDDADLGLWCGPHVVNLKRRGELLGRIPYDQVLGRLKQELDKLIGDLNNGILHESSSHQTT